MGKKLYEKTEEGGIRFSSGRKPGEVRVPNYVYDLWLPLLGATTIGVYNLYCRLERENIVKAISLKNIANVCRIGTDRLGKINGALKKCGFIEVAKPTGWKRLAHYTTEIKVLDPPREVPTWVIGEYSAERGYEPLTPWLVAEEVKTPLGSSENPNGFSGEPKQALDKDLDGPPKFATLGLQPSGVESLDVETVFPENPAADSPAPSKLTTFQQGDDHLTVLAKCAAARAQSANYAVPAPAGGAFALGDRLITAACARLGRSEPEGEKRQQALAFFDEALKAEGLLGDDGVLTVGAVRDWLDPEGEYAFFLPQYALTTKHELALRHFGIVLSMAKAAHRKQDDRRAHAVAANAEALAARPARASPEDKPEDDALGRQIKADLQARMGNRGWPAYRDCVAPCSIYREDGTLHVVAPDEDTVNWMRGQADPVIRRHADGLAVEYEVTA